MRRLLGQLRESSGVALLVVLWVLIILSVFAMGLSRRIGVDLQLTQNSLGQIRARYLVLAALHYAVAHIDLDSQHDGSKGWDTGYQCGFVLRDGQDPEDIFKDIKVKDGSFSLFYQEEGAGGQDIRYGFQDEDRKVNLNAVDRQNYGVLNYLLLELGINSDTAERIASAVVDWRDENNEMLHATYGAEDDYYMSLEQAYHCKNGPFESLEELQLVQGMTPDLFKRLRPYVTIFPERGNLTVNVNTASGPVLRAVARNYAGRRTQAGLGDADALVRKILDYRAGGDGREATEDDRPVEILDLGLNAAERVIADQMGRNWSQVSRFLRVRVQSRDNKTMAKTDMEVVVSREDGKIVWWRRQQHRPYLAKRRAE